MTNKQTFWDKQDERYQELISYGTDKVKAKFKNQNNIKASSVDTWGNHGPIMGQ